MFSPQASRIVDLPEVCVGYLSQYDVKREISNTMNKSLKQKIVTVCNHKIKSKGSTVGLSFYAFFANKNDNPKLLMEVAEWWILENKLDHFEKAAKIKKMVEDMD